MRSELAATPVGAERPRSLLALSSRVLCLVGGLLLGAYCVYSAGIARVAEVVRDAGIWVPALVALELTIITIDAFAARVLLLGTATESTLDQREALPIGRSPFGAWVRATALANACAVFLPAGRAAGEGARGAALASGFGLSRVVAAFARLQACSLLGTAAASAALALLVATLVTDSRALAPLLLGNAVICAGLGGGVFLLVRNRAVSGWFRRLLAKVAPAVPATPPSRSASAQAVALCTLGRVVQTVQYGIAVLAVGGSFGLRSAVTSEGIHIVGASGGDLMPNQVGAMEAAYRYFAAPLGFADVPARALSIAVVMHGVQVGVALAGLLAAGVMPRARELA